MLEDVLFLDFSSKGEYSRVQKKFCGFEWEAEASVNESLLHIVLWCNRDVEGSLWRCTARVTVHTTGDNSSYDAVRKVSFNKACRSLALKIAKGEFCPKKIEIRFELSEILGYRDPIMYQADFSKPSPNSNVCFTFEKSDVRLYANKEYLGVHSEKMRHLLLKPGTEFTAAPKSSPRMSDFEDDFDVLSVRSDTSASNEDCLEEDVLDCDGIRFIIQDGHMSVSLTNSENAEIEYIMLKDVEPDDFLVLLKTIYPPFADIAKGSVKKLLAMAYRFGVEHIICKCEQYFLSEDGKHLLDPFERLELAISYRMAALQTDCLRNLTTANDVRKLLDDAHLATAPTEMRSILLETLLQRFKTDSDVQKDVKVAPPQNLRKSPKRSISAATAGAQNLVCRLFETVGLSDKKIPASSSHSKLTSVSEYAVPDCSKKAVQNGASSAFSAGAASLKKDIVKQEGIKRNLEFSLKCYREFIRDAEKKVATTAGSTASGPSVQMEGSEVESFSSSSEKPVPPPRRGSLKPLLNTESSDFEFLKDLVFDTFNACELSKDRTIVVGCTRAFSAHDLFADLVLSPYTSMKNVIYSFITHLFAKLYGDKIVQVVRLHFSRKVDAFPQSLAERVAGAIIAGYELRKQLGNDDLLVHELRVYFVKQLTKNFDEFVANIRTGYFPNSFT